MCPYGAGALRGREKAMDSIIRGLERPAGSQPPTQPSSRRVAGALTSPSVSCYNQVQHTFKRTNVFNSASFPSHNAWHRIVSLLLPFKEKLYVVVS